MPLLGGKSLSLWSRLNVHRRDSVLSTSGVLPLPVAAPPPYSASTPVAFAAALDRKAPALTPAPGSAAVVADSDPYGFLSTFDTVFLIDDSASMTGSRWREVDVCLAQIMPLCTAHDPDGLDLYFLNHRASSAAALAPAAAKGPGGYYGLTSAPEVTQLFSRVRPGGGTLTGRRLQSLLDPYLAALDAAGPDVVRPLNMIVLTDGEAQDDPEAVIVQAARRLDRLNAPPYQVGIQFFQVGNDAAAAAALRDLDDALADRASVRDMVDTVTWPTHQPTPVLTAELVLKTVLGAVVRRLDRLPSGK